MRGLAGGVYLVLDAGVCAAGGNDPIDVVDAAVRAGVGTVQVRVKGDVRLLLELTVAVGRRFACLTSPPVLVVDDRVDVVLAARARGVRVDGVHVGQSDLRVVDVRAVLGASSVVGVSAARSDHVAEVVRDDVADYVGVGPVLGTATKPDAGEPVGLDGLAEVVRRVRVPVVGIGGLAACDAGPLRSAGAAGMAVVSAICAARDPLAAAEELMRAWVTAGRSAVVVP